jgi:predicted metalloprotease with PDZ domain
MIPRLIALISLPAVIVTVTVLTAQAPPDLAGRWTLIPDPPAPGASRSGGAPDTAGSGWGGELTITHDDVWFTIERAEFSRYDMQRPLRFVYALDGSESRNVVNMGRGPQEQVSRAVWRANTLVITTRHVSPASPAIEVTHVFSIDESGVLVIETTRGAGNEVQAPATRTRYRRRALDPIVYTMRAPAPETQVLEVEVQVPTGGNSWIDLMLPVWSPGYYVVQDYAANVQDLQARVPDGGALDITRRSRNVWRVFTGGAPAITVGYRLTCRSRFVTGCWVDPTSAVINGPSTYLTLVEQASRPHEVRLEPAPGWPQSMTSLDPVASGGAHAYVGPDYDTFADSPIVAGTISVHEFDVPGTRVVLADFGDLGAWDGRGAAAKIRLIVDEHRRMIGGLPFERYVFLNGFRGGAGGLEHLNSSLLSSSPNPTEPLPTLRWLNYVSHEFFHAINVKRLRPIELGPFDYDNAPRTPSLWLSEGVTTYYGDLAVVRAGVASQSEYLAGLGRQIQSLQTSPGRLVQTLEQSSLDVAAAGGSGVGGDRNRSVSYYGKGAVVGLLLDAHIRHLTDDRRSFDDVMRAAYRKYGGVRGFRPAEFDAIASEIAGADLSAWFDHALRSTGELDYAELLDWYGLRFAEPGSAGPARAWQLEVRPGASPAQRQRLERWLAPTREPLQDASDQSRPIALASASGPPTTRGCSVVASRSLGMPSCISRWDAMTPTNGW